MQEMEIAGRHQDVYRTELAPLKEQKGIAKRLTQGCQVWFFIFSPYRLLFFPQNIFTRKNPRKSSWTKSDANKQRKGTCLRHAITPEFPQEPFIFVKMLHFGVIHVHTWGKYTISPNKQHGTIGFRCKMQRQ